MMSQVLPRSGGQIAVSLGDTLSIVSSTWKLGYHKDVNWSTCCKRGGGPNMDSYSPYSYMYQLFKTDVAHSTQSLNCGRLTL